MQSQVQAPQPEDKKQSQGGGGTSSLEAFKNLLSRLAELKSQQERVGQ